MSSPANDDDLDGDSTLFFGTIVEFGDFKGQANLYFQTVEKNDSVRLLVLETWLFVDFTIRKLLLSGLGLRGLDESDLRDMFLPRGLRECVRLVTKLRELNLRLPGPPEDQFRATRRKWKYLQQHHGEALNQLLAAEEEYGKTYSLDWAHPDQNQTFTTIFSSWPTVYRTVSQGWLDITARIDDEWVRRQERLNEARNVAAHFHDETKIARKFGISGENAVGQVKTECLELVGTLIGVTSESQWLRGD